MATPTREEAIDTLEEGHGQLSELLARVPDDDLVRPATIGGGEWSAKDLIGHIATWEEAGIDAMGSVRHGQVPRIEAVFREEGGVDRYNAEQIPRNSARSLAETREHAIGIHETLVTMIRAMSDEEWTGKLPYPTERRTTMVALLGSITGAPRRPFGHAFAHIPDLEAFVDSLR